jgi:hypothetical protein
MAVAPALGVQHAPGSREYWFGSPTNQCHLSRPILHETHGLWQGLLLTRRNLNRA